MANKKSKRQKASVKGTNSPKSRGEFSGAEEMPKRVSSSEEQFRGGSNSYSERSTTFNPDYTYVKRDLSRIGILAGSFLVILIALSFFIK